MKTLAIILSLIPAVCLVCRSTSMASGPPAAIVATAPEGEPLCDDYTLRVANVNVPVHACRVSAVPFNQVWPGYQRPIDQTELAGFACWDMAGPARVEIESRRPVQNVAIRPDRLGIQPHVQGNRISFDLIKPTQLVIEVNGPHRALHLFADSPQVQPPPASGPDLHYFAPGVHRPGRITLKDGQSVYIAPGAVVYGSIHASGARNIAIRGRGIIDVGPFERGKGGGAIRLTDCSGVIIDGVVLRDPDVWCLSMFGCRNVRVSNVKLIGLWRYNADGIDVCNSSDVTVSDCFVRAFDDALVVKGLKFGKNSLDDRPVRNVAFSRCTLWCDWGRAMEIGAETCAPEIANVSFSDCDIIRTTHIAMDIQHGDRAAVHDIRFEDIRVHMDEKALAPRMQQRPDDCYSSKLTDFLPRLMVIDIRNNNYTRDAQRGTVRDVLFRNIAITAPKMPDSYFSGQDAQHDVRGVAVEGLRLNGKPVADAPAARLSLRQHVSDVTVRPATQPLER